MPLSNETKCRLEESINWPRINVAMLHPSDIERLEKAFRGLIDDGMDYSIDDLDTWLKTYFIGEHEDTRKNILNIARDSKKPLRGASCKTPYWDKK